MENHYFALIVHMVKSNIKNSSFSVSINVFLTLYRLFSDFDIRLLYLNSIIERLTPQAPLQQVYQAQSPSLMSE